MNEQIIKKVQNEIFDFFVQSKDFNGISLKSLADKTAIDAVDLIEVLKFQISISAINIEYSINPHIISLGHYDIQTQIKILSASVDKGSFRNQPICIYPSPKYLKENRNVDEFKHLPFTEKLALAEPQLKPYFFEIEVLEKYYTNPRYRFYFSDYSGQISYQEDENDIPLVSENDQIFIQNFGLGFTANNERVAAVYLRYLNDLTPEHQLLWSNKMVKTECKILREYYVNTIEGDFTNSRSVFSAFIGEQKAVYDLSCHIFGESLFNKTFDKDDRPQEFTFFMVPTLKNYNDFVLLLDKMISENINKIFF